MSRMRSLAARQGPRSGVFGALSSVFRPSQTDLSRREQCSPRHPQIRQSKQRRHLCSVLGKSAIAHLDVAKLPLDDAERMLALCPDAGDH